MKRDIVMAGDRCSIQGEFKLGECLVYLEATGLITNVSLLKTTIRLDERCYIKQVGDHKWTDLNFFPRALEIWNWKFDSRFQKIIDKQKSS